ncbi:hypothetical protein MTO98_19930 [Mucilaginibacter sp. SMC90]|uniref:hypothetical protein n=1 Tax=Mucilaginibacter sp. SMC90 TaxID=2929803 RepID=UPI001FB355B4|nr:hypothetical protein [Mucilaginibacter sp. SMC90]UOE46677.1 hypothetical protein MTO98_19930 [Mucilaginibacter sp. SMC90]
MQNIANEAKGHVLPFTLPAALFTLQIIEDAFHPQQLYPLFYGYADPLSGFSSFKNLST